MVEDTCFARRVGLEGPDLFVGEHRQFGLIVFHADQLGAGLGFATTITPTSTLIPGSAGDFFWGGAASTFFWVDPREDLIVLFLTQLLPSSAHPVRRQFRTLVYSAITG